MKDYEILAKFLIPLDQIEVLLRDSMCSAVYYAGCYLLKDTRTDPEEWYRDNRSKSICGYNPACKYVVAFEDYGNVFLESDAVGVNESDLDQREGYWNYTDALLGFQEAINTLILEMNTTEVLHRTQRRLG